MTTIWVDAHLSPAIATWITSTFGITAIALRDLNLRDAEETVLRYLENIKTIAKCTLSVGKN